MRFLNVKIVNSYSWDITFQPGYNAILPRPSTTRGYANGNRGLLVLCFWIKIIQKATDRFLPKSNNSEGVKTVLLMGQCCSEMTTIFSYPALIIILIVYLPFIMASCNSYVNGCAFSF